MFRVLIVFVWVIFLFEGVIEFFRLMLIILVVEVVIFVKSLVFEVGLNSW